MVEQTVCNGCFRFRTTVTVISASMPSYDWERHVKLTASEVGGYCILDYTVNETPLFHGMHYSNYVVFGH